MKRLYLGLLICLCFTSTRFVAAQEYMPIALEFYPGAHLSDAPAGTIPGNMQVAFYKIGLGYGLPLKLGNGQIVLGARYESLHIDLLDSDSFVLASPDNLHYARIEMRLTQSLGNGWGVIATASPGYASDFKELGVDDFRFLGGLILTKHASASLQYGVGATHTSDFGKPLLIPVASVNWENGRNLRFNALLPLRAELGYQLNARHEIGFKVNTSGTQYNINLDASKFDFIEGTDEIDLPAKYSVMTIGPTYRQRIAGPFYITVDAGLTIRRKFEFDGEVVNGTLDQDPSFFLSTGLSMRP